MLVLDGQEALHQALVILDRGQDALHRALVFNMSAPSLGERLIKMRIA